MSKNRIPALPGSNKQERDMMRTFMGCYIAEERVSYLKSSDFYKTGMALVTKGWLQLGKDDGRYQFFSLTQKGKSKLVAREYYYASKF